VATHGTASELLGRWVSDGDCLGGQLFAWRDGTVEVDAAVGGAGDGGPASTGDVVRLYCAVKPVTALVLVAAAQAGKVRLDDPVGRFLPGFADADRHGVTLRSLLSHHSGMMDHGFDLNQRHYRDVARILGRYTYPAASWYAEPSYNDTTAWCILAAVVEEVYGQPFVDVVDALGLDGPTFSLPETVRFVPYHALRDGRFVSLEDPDAARLSTVVNPAHGGFGSAGRLGRFYAELVRCAGGAGHVLTAAAVRSATRPVGVVDFGAGLGRKPYGLGFACDVRQDAVGGQWSADSFGHGGYVGQYKVVHGFADLTHRAAVAVCLYSVGAKNAWRLRILTGALAGELGIGGGDDG
jgi:CubicO group peptidase (beta-lactamase class C family)